MTTYHPIAGHLELSFTEWGWLLVAVKVSPGSEIEVIHMYIQIIILKKPWRWHSLLQCLPCMRKVVSSNPSHNRLKLLKQLVTAPLPNAHKFSEMTIINGCHL